MAQVNVSNRGIAFNPLPWAWTGSEFDFSVVPSLPALASVLKPAGFAAIQADVPDGLTASVYGEQLRDAGLMPAPGYFQASFESSAAVELARRTAADQAELGLTEVFVACTLNDTRVARPGRGVDADEDRIARIAEHLAIAAAEMVAEGVTPCLHPHAGTWIETAEEAEAVLLTVDESVLLLGPDNGHLTWAGIDPVAFVRRHAARVGAVHVKDFHLGALDASRHRGDDLFAAMRRHIWAEPGRGDADLDGLLDALGPNFDGWIVVEVDAFDLPTPEESVAAAGAWAKCV